MTDQMDDGHVGSDDWRNITLENVFRTEYDGMVGLAFTLIGNSEEAEEVVQDAFVDISNHLGDLEAPGAYLRTIVVNRCRSALRRRRVITRHLQRSGSDLPPQLIWLSDVLDRLPDEQRTAVVLKFYCGLRATEIGEIVDAPASTIRSHLRRALTAMREELTS